MIGINKIYLFSFILFVATFIFLLSTTNNYEKYGGMSTFYNITAVSLIENNTYAINPRLDEFVSKYQKENKKLMDPEDYPKFQCDECYKTIKRPPGYSLFLAAIYKIAPEKKIIYPIIVQGLLYFFSLLFLYKYLIIFSNKKFIKMSVLLISCWIPLVLINIKILAISLIMPFLIFSLFFLIKFIKNKNYFYIILCGLCITFLAYLRSEFFIFSFFLIPFIYLYKQNIFRAFKIAIFLQLIVILLMSPWAYRNYLLSGDIVFTSKSKGIVLWEGLGERQNNWGAIKNDAIIHSEFERLGISDRNIRDDILFNKYLNVLKQDPYFVIESIFIRFANTFYIKADWGNSGYIREKIRKEYTKDFKFKLKFFKEKPLIFMNKYLPRFLEFLIYIFSYLGIYLSIVNKEKDMIFLLSPYVFLVIINSMTHTETRYVSPSIFCLIIFSMYALEKILYKKSCADL